MPTQQRTLAALTAVLTWSAVLVQGVLSVRRGIAEGDSMARAVADYLSYFTVLTNLAVALVVTAPLVAPQARWARALTDRRVTWTVAAAILVVGIAYHLLLSDINNPTGIEAVADLGLHYVTPALYAAYWVRYTDVSDLRWGRVAPALGVYPSLYFAYLLGRGEVVASYPYFFIDVGTLGLAAVLRNAGGLLAFHLAVAWALLMVARRVPARAP